jgi:hypothetical protein
MAQIVRDNDVFTWVDGELDAIMGAAAIASGETSD